MKIQIQQRKNPMTGKMKYRALIIMNDRVISGWGDTAEEADFALKNQIMNMGKQLKMRNSKIKNSKK